MTATKARACTSLYNNNNPDLKKLRLGISSEASYERKDSLESIWEIAIARAYTKLEFRGRSVMVERHSSSHLLFWIWGLYRIHIC